VIWRDLRLTLALTSRLPDDPLPAVVEKRLNPRKPVGLHPTVL
jgi:hypothetical protein